jgi:hypothetical protein
MGTQDENSGHQILQENSGNHWNMEVVFRLEIIWIFPVDSFQLPVLSGKNRPDCSTWEV